MTRSLRRALPLGVLLATLGCSGGLNCGSGCSDAYPFPQSAAAVPNGAQFVDSGVRMRLSQSALDFIVANLQPILATQLGNDPANPDFITIPIPDTAFGGTVSLGAGSQERRPTRAIIDGSALADRMTVEFTENPQGILITLDDIPFGFDGRVFGELDGFADAACDIKGTNPAYGGFPFITGISFEMLITPRVGQGAECDEAGGQGECLKLSVDVRQVGIGDFGSNAIAVTKPPNCRTNVGRTCDESADCAFGSNCFRGQCVGDGEGACSEDCSDNRICTLGICVNNPADSEGDVECSGVCGVTDFFVGVAASIVGFIEPIIEPLLDNVMQIAITNALEDVDGAPLSASGRLDIAGFAPGILPDSALDLGFAIAPAGSAFRVSTPSGGTKGMDLVLKSGFEAAPPLDDSEGLTVPHPCVRPIEGLEFGDLYGGRSEFFVPDTLVTPLTGSTGGEGYDIGASLAKGAINQTMFALYNTGSLCLEISSDAINGLTGGGFQLSAGTLDLLTQGKLKQYAAADAPAIIALNPAQPPVISYGAGTVDEGHIIVSWPNVEISFYVLMYERFSRVFAVSADISMQIAVFNEPGTETLRIAIINGPTVGNFQENYNELLPGVNFTEVLESLVSVAFDAALGNGLEFNYDVGSALSGALGVPIFIDFQGVETLPASQREVLNVYLSMRNTPPQPRTVGPAGLHLAREPGLLRIPDAEDYGTTTRPSIPTGSATLDVDDGDGREFFARIDFGAWRGPLVSHGGTLVVHDPKLRFTGEHTITVRSRLANDAASLEADGDTLTVWVDGQPPQVRLERDGDFVVAIGSDDASLVGDLEYAWQLDDGQPGDFAPLDRLALADVSARRVAVVARDRAGNLSKPAAIDAAIERRRRTDERELASRVNAFHCDASSSDGMALWSAALLGLGAIGRRRRRQP